MLKGINAVIFDMDGVLIDSEPLWRRAMIKGFNQFGMNLTEDDCRKTLGSRINEVVDFWVKHFSINQFSSEEIEKVIIANLIELIDTEGKPIPGIFDILDFCKEKKLKVGLATSSSERIMNIILNKLELTNYFDATITAQYLKHGKPHPEVFLICAQDLGVEPINCMVIEDSVTGAIAAKSAQMKLIVVPDQGTKNQEKFAIADYKLNSMEEVLKLLKYGNF